MTQQCSLHCAVCLEKVASDIALPCDHRMCPSCLVKWTPQTCPLCRQKYSVSQTLSHCALEKHIMSSGKTRTQVKTCRKELVTAYVTLCARGANETSDVEIKQTCIKNIFETVCKNQWMLENRKVRKVVIMKLDEFEPKLLHQIRDWRRRLFAGAKA